MDFFDGLLSIKGIRCAVAQAKSEFCLIESCGISEYFAASCSGNSLSKTRDLLICVSTKAQYVGPRLMTLLPTFDFCKHSFCSENA